MPVPEQGPVQVDREGVIRFGHEDDLGTPGVAAVDHPHLIQAAELPDAKAAREAIAKEGLSEDERALMEHFVVGQEVVNPGLTSDQAESGFRVSAVREDGMVEVAKPFLDERGKPTGLYSRYAYDPAKIAAAQPVFTVGQMVEYQDRRGQWGKWRVDEVFPDSGAVRLHFDLGSRQADCVASAAELERHQPQPRTEPEAASADAGAAQPKRSWRNGFGLLRRR